MGKDTSEKVARFWAQYENIKWCIWKNLAGE